MDCPFKSPHLTCKWDFEATTPYVVKTSPSLEVSRFNRPHSDSRFNIHENVYIKYALKMYTEKHFSLLTWSWCRVCGYCCRRPESTGCLVQGLDKLPTLQEGKDWLNQGSAFAANRKLKPACWWKGQFYTAPRALHVRIRKRAWAALSLVICH